MNPNPPTQRRARLPPIPEFQNSFYVAGFAILIFAAAQTTRLVHLVYFVLKMSKVSFYGLIIQITTYDRVVEIFVQKLC